MDFLVYSTKLVWEGLLSTRLDCLVSYFERHVKSFTLTIGFIVRVSTISPMGWKTLWKLFAVLRPDGPLGALSEFHQTTDPGMQRYFRQDVKLIHLHYDLTDNTVSNTGHSLRSDDLVLAWVACKWIRCRAFRIFKNTKRLKYNKNWIAIWKGKPYHCWPQIWVGKQYQS